MRGERDESAHDLEVVGERTYWMAFTSCSWRGAWRARLCAARWT